MIRFYIALWISKLYMFLTKIIKKDKSDKVGFLAHKICPDVLTKIAKPKLVIMVTGTNGKTTVSNLIHDMLKSSGMKVGFNDWGANLLAGHIRCLLTCVNIFNKPKMDACVLECDELISPQSMPYINPNYVIVTNISRDSIRRNSYPEYIFDKINTAISGCKNTTVVLNADDPISSFIDCDKKVFVSIDKFNKDIPYENISPDFCVCPKCNGKIEYLYKHYRHIGKFKCLKCGLKSFNGDYIVSNVDYKNEEMTIDKYKYPIISKSIYNIYNELLVIALFKDLKYTDSQIRKWLKALNIPKSRENLITVKGINVYSRMAKGQNTSAASSVYENLAKDDRNKELVLILDEVYDGFSGQETITWLYDTDYEILTKSCFKKIIVIGERNLDYKLRLKLAGIEEKRIVCLPTYDDVCKYLDYNKDIDIYVLFELDRGPDSREVVKMIANYIEEVVR